MNKQDLISKLCRLNGLSKAEYRKVVDRFFGAMADALAQGQRVEIRGLCAFKLKTYDSYKGRNPKTSGLKDIAIRVRVEGRRTLPGLPSAITRRPFVRR